VIEVSYFYGIQQSMFFRSSELHNLCSLHFPFRSEVFCTNKIYFLLSRLEKNFCVGPKALTSMIVVCSAMWPIQNQRKFSWKSSSFCRKLRLATCFQAGFLLSYFFRPLIWRQSFLPKHLLTFNGLYNSIFKEKFSSLLRWNSVLYCICQTSHFI
jgi:hypothetical protein